MAGAIPSDSDSDSDSEHPTRDAEEPLLNGDHRINLRRCASNATSQVALVGSNVSPIESLDYELIENDFFKHDWRSRGGVETFQYVLLKWTLCFLIGALAGGIGFFNNLAVENIAGIKFVVTSNLMLANKYGRAFGVFAVSNLVLTMFATVITTYIAPAAAGSGIPEVKAYLNGVDAPGIFSLRTLIVKVLGSIAAVSSSLHVGKAGPLVHTGACLASLLGQGGSCKYHLTCKWLRYFKNDKDRRDLVTCGSAAGIAAAFRAPVGGVLFALESVSSWWRSSLLWRAFFTTATVAVLLRAMIEVCRSGKCGLFGKGGLIMFDVTSDGSVYHLVDLPPVIALGVIGGILGALYNFLLIKVLRVYNLINEKGRIFKLLIAATVSILTSCCLFGLPWLASCRACPDASTIHETCPSIGRSGNFKKFQCSPQNYNDLASLFFNTNDDTIRNLFSADADDVFQYSSVVLFFITSYFLGILSYGVVAPTGLFVPVILTGATYGRLVGMLVRAHSTLDHGLFAVLGAASLLGGTMRMTVSICVIMLELTNNLLLLPLVMLVVLISKTVADACNANIYDLILKLKGLPYLEAHVEPYMRQLTVSDVVTGPLQIFDGVEQVGNIVHILKTTGHHAFPVVDEPPFSDSPVLFGIVLRAHLLVLLKKKNFLSSRVRTGDDASVHFTTYDFLKRGSGKCDNIDDIELSAEEMEMYIDLHPFTNTSPYTVVETMSLAKALILFREVGLWHLLVIPKYSSVHDIAWGKHTRVVLDVGCGVASFGGYLFERDVLTMSFAPKDEHEAQVQLALERGIPAMSAVMGSQRLPFPSRVFDLVHCARCRVPWHADGGMLLLELNRVLRPGGYFVWSATTVYQRLKEDVEIWKAMKSLTVSMCWDLISIKKDKLNSVGAAFFRKPVSNECYDNRKHHSPPMCKEDDDPNAAWYIPPKTCMHRVPVDASERGSKWPEQWPQRLKTPPYWLNSSQIGVYGKPAPDDFQSDYEHWKRVVTKSYLTGFGIDWSKVRNVMDMRAVYGGFSAALRDLKVWSLNVINIDSPDILPIIYERGLFGIYHDWCESFSTYPRTYDLLHADHLFSKLKKICKIVPALAEVDRIVRPGGKLIVRDESRTITEVENLLKSLHWEVHLTFSKGQEGILCAEKSDWRPEKISDSV